MKVSPVRRNQSAYDLKCLTAFYSYPPDVFCLALSTLDRFITKVKVRMRERWAAREGGREEVLYEQSACADLCISLCISLWPMYVTPSLSTG